MGGWRTEDTYGANMAAGGRFGYPRVESYTGRGKYYAILWHYMGIGWELFALCYCLAVWHTLGGWVDYYRGQYLLEWNTLNVFKDSA